MRKIASILLCLAFALALTIPAFAAGTDDGTLSVTTKDGKKYFGTAQSEYAVQFVAADGSGDTFLRFGRVDLNGDTDMNVCDLVSLHNNSTDINSDGAYDAADSKTLRLLLLGENDF